jgi:hypothetical protein
MREHVERLTHVDFIVMEYPQWYYGKGNARFDDLAQLCSVDGFIQGLWPEVDGVSFHPTEWKGQVPKDIHHARLMRILTPDDIAKVKLPIASLAHNVWDAVALAKMKEVR